ncbi:hypothetical protein CBR_g30087 [Chara braunii]|uniref:Uncharacterized protein n=1 Tax=Chara braunii TaxID=69332 RepID=A0A388LCA0_CHABU|nr:hypothetical protein CBR_g30087 [Chara braunii]|eukprot:GBG79823.1 hypothetical protein CBR_g30087 [Chara braunii]
MRVVLKNAEQPAQGGGSCPDKQGEVKIPRGQTHSLLLLGKENLVAGAVHSREECKDAEERVNEACMAVNAVANGSRMALVIAAENGVTAPVDAAAANEGPAEHRGGQLAGTDADGCDGTNGDSKGMRNSPCNCTPKPTAKKAQGKQATVKKSAADESKPSEDNAMSAPAGRKKGTKRAAEDKPSVDKPAKKQKKEKAPPVEKATKEDKPLDDKPIKRQRKEKKPPDEEVAKGKKPSDIKSENKQRKGKKPLEEEATKENDAAEEAVPAPGMVETVPLPAPRAAETIPAATPSTVEPTQAKVSVSVEPTKSTVAPEAADAATEERTSRDAEEVQNCGGKNGNSKGEIAGSQEQAIKAKGNSTPHKTRHPPSDEWVCIHGCGKKYSGNTRAYKKHIQEFCPKIPPITAPPG